MDKQEIFFFFIVNGEIAFVRLHKKEALRVNGKIKYKIRQKINKRSKIA